DCLLQLAPHDTLPFVLQAAGFTDTYALSLHDALPIYTNGEVLFCYMGKNGGLDTITAFVDSNENHKKDASEPEDTATRNWLANRSEEHPTEHPSRDQLVSTHPLEKTITKASTPAEGVQ